MADDQLVADRAEHWRQAALAFERRAMRVELALRLLVAAGHVTQEKADESLSIAGKNMPAGVRENRYRCGHCGYEGPCYGNGFSAPWCKQCQRNDKLEPADGVQHPARTIEFDQRDGSPPIKGVALAAGVAGEGKTASEKEVAAMRKVREWMRENLHPNWHGHLLMLALLGWVIWEAAHGR